MHTTIKLLIPIFALNICAPREIFASSPIDKFEPQDLRYVPVLNSGVTNQGLAFFTVVLVKRYLNGIRPVQKLKSLH